MRPCSKVDFLRISSNITTFIDNNNTTDTTPIRLVGGHNDHEGRVEVLINGNWGTVCDDGWSIHAGNVVCRMLGLGPASSAPTSAAFGSGTGDIFFDGLSCLGTEEDLSECRHHVHGDHDCSHSEDAGVICEPGNVEYFVSISLYNNITY